MCVRQFFGNCGFDLTTLSREFKLEFVDLDLLSVLFALSGKAEPFSPFSFLMVAGIRKESSLWDRFHSPGGRKDLKEKGLFFCLH